MTKRRYMKNKINSDLILKTLLLTALTFIISNYTTAQNSINPSAPNQYITNADQDNNDHSVNYNATKSGNNTATQRSLNPAAPNQHITNADQDNNDHSVDFNVTRAGNQIVVDFDLEVNKPGKLELFDTTGRQVITDYLYHDHIGFEKTYNIDGLSQGIYIVVVQQGNQVVSKKYYL
jgi:hypothetical protein